MRAKTKTSYILIAALAAFGVFVLFLMRNWKTAPYSSGYGPGFYPMVLVIVLFLLLVILFVQETLSDRNSRKISASAVEGADADEHEFTLSRAKYPAIMFGMMILYSILLEKLGFMIDTFAFLVFGMFLLKGRSALNIVLSAFFTAILYFVFGKLLLVRLPAGIFFGG